MFLNFGGWSEIRRDVRKQRPYKPRERYFAQIFENELILHHFSFLQTLGPEFGFDQIDIVNQWPKEALFKN